MEILIKTVISVAIILAATAVGKNFPSTAGLISVMPITSVLILVWTYLENKGNPSVMQAFTKGALWGILPTILFFLVAFFCFKRQLTLPFVLAVSFVVWAGAALIHQWMLR